MGTEEESKKSSIENGVDMEDPPSYESTEHKKEDKKDDDDVWHIEFEVEKGKPWSEKSCSEAFIDISWTLTRICIAGACLWLFVCAISLLGDAFQVLTGKAAGEIFSNSEFLKNPVVGLVIGILVTVLVQSSSTSTSIVVTLVAAKVIEVQSAIFICMGANVGTSVTNTIVSMTQSMDRNQFRRAFAGATVHDCFNLMAVLIILPVEWASSYLFYLTDAIVSTFNIQQGSEVDILSGWTDPIVEEIVKVNKTVITIAAQNISLLADNSSMINVYCGKAMGWILVDEEVTNIVDVTLDNGTVVQETITSIKTVNETFEFPWYPTCTIDDFLFANDGLGDVVNGVILLIMSLIMLCGCLIIMVKCLNSLLRGTVARWLQVIINMKFRKPFGWVTGYIALLFGAGLTFCFQSSSVFTSILTPLVGVGMISIERMYPLTLGANIGTTTTAILAALASDSSVLDLTLQVALAHFFFNISGILLYYPIPFMRFPIPASMFLGDTTAQYRWFAVLYLLTLFFIVPGIMLGFSFISTIVSMCIFFVIIGVFLIIMGISTLQRKYPSWLPKSMRTWDFLPVYLRSLAPYDKFFTKYLLCCCSSLKQDQEAQQEVETIEIGESDHKLEESKEAYDNAAFTKL